MMVLTTPASTSSGEAGRKRSEDAVNMGAAPPNVGSVGALLLPLPYDTADHHTQQQQQHNLARNVATQ
jgi:hypothetical protein